MCRYGTAQLKKKLTTLTLSRGGPPGGLVVTQMWLACVAEAIYNHLESTHLLGVRPLRVQNRRVGIA